MDNLPREIINKTVAVIFTKGLELAHEEMRADGCFQTAAVIAVLVYGVIAILCVVDVMAIIANVVITV